MERIETMEQFWMQGETVEDGFLFAMFTDEIVWESWPLEPERRESLRQKEKNLLDIRIFNSAKELRMFRGDVGRDFRGRMAEDTEAALEEQDYFDEEQYLDIDGKCSEELFGQNHMVQATGGGRYSLPLPGFENAKIRIRNYLGYYEESGQAYVKDWRLAGLFQEKG